MSIEVFGVTYTTLRQYCFPRLDNWSATSSPTSTIVAGKIDVAAARLIAGLAKEGITAAAVVALGAASASYVICADIVRKIAALSLYIPTDDPETAKSWAADVEAFFKQLAKDASVALGSTTELSTASSPPNGPTTHLTEYDLDVDSTDVMSDATMPLHSKDPM